MSNRKVITSTKPLKSDIVFAPDLLLLSEEKINEFM